MAQLSERQKWETAWVELWRYVEWKGLDHGYVTGSYRFRHGTSIRHADTDELRQELDTLEYTHGLPAYCNMCDKPRYGDHKCAR